MILIIQNGIVDTGISKYLDKKFEIIKSSDTIEIDLAAYSLIIILGGQQHLTEINIDKNLLKVCDLIRKCIEINKPVLGICLGCQLIAYTLGCKIKTSNKLNVGYDTKILGFNNIFRCHYDHIEPNEKITILDTFDDMVYVFKYKQLLGIQCHPDIPPEYIHKYYNDLNYINYAKENTNIIDKNNKDLLHYLLNNLKKIDY